MLHHIENHIEKMRQKPDHVKTQYAFFVSLGITLVIFGFWITSHTLALNPEAEAVAAKTTPVQALTANAVGAFDYVKSMFVGNNQAKYDASANIEVVGGKN